MSDNPVSFRNLQEGFSTPLRKFTAVLDSYVPEPAQGYEGTRVNLNFRDVEALQSIEPFNMPTFVINLGLSNKKESKWGYLGTSLTNLLPDADIDDIVNKKVGLVFCDGQSEKPENKPRPEPKPIWNKDADRAEFPDGRIPVPVWTFYSVEGTVAGAGSTTAADQAKKLLDGKGLSDFNKDAFADPIIRKDAELQRSITDKSFVKAMLASKEFTKDESDIYHRAAATEKDLPF